MSVTKSKPQQRVDATELVRDASRMMYEVRRVERLVETIHLRRLEIVAQLAEAGMRQSDIARLLDLSRQRVTQLIDRLREEGRLPPEGG